MSRSLWMIAGLVALLFSLQVSVASAADEAPVAPNSDEPAAEKPADEKPAEEAAEVDIYEVPTTTDSAELLKFIYRLRDFQPKSRVEALDHQKRASNAAFLAADRILSFEKDKTSEAYRFAFPLAINRQLMALRTKSPEAQAKVVEDVTAFLASAPKIEINEARLMMMVGRAVESSDNDELAEQAYTKFSEMLAKADEPQLQDLGKKFAGSVRRMKLVGQEMEVSGTKLDGTKFDVASLKGKTVLVDFWATWCGPCLATIPQLRESYAAYHDKGFEIVGVSVDAERSDLDQFMEKEKLPWTILNEEGGQNPAASYYGISGIPAMFLIGADGKVVSTNARGPELTRLLEERFGPIPEKKPAEDKDEAKPEEK